MPVKYIGSTAPESVLYGVSHWPTRNAPQGPSSPIAVLRDAMLDPPPSTFTADSTCQETVNSRDSGSLPRNPRFDEFDVTRVRRGTSMPVGMFPTAPGGRAPAAVAPLASTASTSTFRVP